MSTISSTTITTTPPLHDTSSLQKKCMQQISLLVFLEQKRSCTADCITLFIRSLSKADRRQPSATWRKKTILTDTPAKHVLK